MPSLAQLAAEPWWDREIVTSELDWLGDELCRILGRPRSAFGTKGNERHLNGGHRSQEWIKNSDYCTNTSYTVQTGLTAEQARHIAASDYTPGTWGTAANRSLVASQTRALWDAARRGELTGLRQIQGTLDGRNPIGLNVLSGSTMVPDTSHVEHWHLTFDRKYMRDRGLMQRILSIVIGDDMSWQENLTAGPDGGGKTYEAGAWLIGTNIAAWNTYNRLGAFMATEETRDAATSAALTAITEAIRAGGGSIEIAPVLERITAEATLTRMHVEERHQAEMRALEELHRTQLAEKAAELAGLQAELDALKAAAGS